MCWCDPNNRTPKCASLQCVPPLMVLDPTNGIVRRAEESREAYAARRLPPLDSLTGADLSGIDRPAGDEVK